VSVKRLDLMPDGPLARIDRALGLVRSGGIDAVLRAIAGGTVVALAVLSAFWIERVEGVFELRLGIAVGLVAAFALRSVLLAGVARGYVRGLWEAVEIPPAAGSPLSIARTAAWVSLGLSFWGAFFLAATVLGPVAVVLFAPLLALRGMGTPGWLARVACTTDAGTRALRGAFSDNAQQRGENLTVEFLMVLAALGITINLLATSAFVLLLVRSFVGIELALLDQFLSSRNTFTMLAAVLFSLVLLEPLRAALSAIVYVDARVRGEGLDVRAAIDAAVDHASHGRKRARSAAAAVFFLAATWCVVPSAHAQPPPAPEAPGALATDPTVVPDTLERDAEVRARAERILSGPEYREFADTRGRGLRDLIDRWFADLFRSDPEPEEGDTGTGLSLPLPGPGLFIAIGVVLALMVAVYLFVSRERPLPLAEDGSAPPAKAEDPRDRAPEAWVDAATELAREGRYREALRALYLATLVALDRRQAITFDPTLTNWQYLRQLSGNSMRSDFRELTRIFDHKWYGKEETVEVDYEVCRQLADRMLARTQREAVLDAERPSPREAGA
jgi:hypothetical protein